MRKISDIYKEYKIIHNLELHQLRVASVAMQICDSLNIEVDKETILIAAIVHDMGNIIKSDLNYFPKFLEPEGLQYWQKVKDEFINKYGSVEHEATTNIVREIGMPEKIVEIISQNKFDYLCHIKENNDWVLKILKYSDMRVGPNGVISFKERMDEFNQRYGNKPGSLGEKEVQRLIACGQEIENQIFSHSNIKPDDISDNSIKSYMEKLKDFEI